MFFEVFRQNYCDDFSKEELESILPDNDIRGYDRIPYPLSHVLVRQLLDSMREVEMLRSSIGNLEPLRDFDWHGKWRIIGCLDALQNPNKESNISQIGVTSEGLPVYQVNGAVTPKAGEVWEMTFDGDINSVPCATCGKPMEDRGAETQWCAECSSKTRGDNEHC